MSGGPAPGKIPPVTDDTSDLPKPRPRERALAIHELRRMVTARHKMLGGTKPVEEAVQLIRDEYGADHDSSLRFVEWLRGGPAEDPPSKGAVERRHIVADPETGDEREVDTQPGSIPPRPLR